MSCCRVTWAVPPQSAAVATTDRRKHANEPTAQDACTTDCAQYQDLPCSERPDVRCGAHRTSGHACSSQRLLEIQLPDNLTSKNLTKTLAIDVRLVGRISRRPDLSHDRLDAILQPIERCHILVGNDQVDVRIARRARPGCKDGIVYDEAGLLLVLAQLLSRWYPTISCTHRTCPAWYGWRSLPKPVLRCRTSNRRQTRQKSHPSTMPPPQSWPGNAVSFRYLLLNQLIEVDRPDCSACRGARHQARSAPAAGASAVLLVPAGDLLQSNARGA